MWKLYIWISFQLYFILRSGRGYLDISCTCPCIVRFILICMLTSCFMFSPLGVYSRGWTLQRLQMEPLEWPLALAPLAPLAWPLAPLEWHGWTWGQKRWAETEGQHGHLGFGGSSTDLQQHASLAEGRGLDPSTSPSFEQICFAECVLKHKTNHWAKKQNTNDHSYLKVTFTVYSHFVHLLSLCNCT